LADRLAVVFVLFTALPFAPAFDLTGRFALPRAMVFAPIPMNFALEGQT
jgi:hypothetical protein